MSAWLNSAGKSSCAPRWPMRTWTAAGWNAYRTSPRSAPADSAQPAARRGLLTDTGFGCGLRCLSLSKDPALPIARAWAPAARHPLILCKALDTATNRHATGDHIAACIQTVSRGQLATGADLCAHVACCLLAQAPSSRQPHLQLCQQLVDRGTLASPACYHPVEDLCCIGVLCRLCNGGDKVVVNVPVVCVHLPQHLRSSESISG